MKRSLLYFSVTMVVVALSSLFGRPGNSCRAAEDMNLKHPFDTVTDEERAKIEQAIPAKAPARPAKPRKLMIYDRSAGRSPHKTVPHTNLAFSLMGKKTGAFEAVFETSPQAYEAENLKQYDAIFLNNTIGNLFTDPQLRQNLIDFVENGGGLMGVHGTTLAFTKWPGGQEQWPEFAQLLGARGASHRISNEEVVLKLDDPNHPIVKAFAGKSFKHSDEFFRFTSPYSRENVRVLLSFDTEKTDLNQGKGYGTVTREDGDYAVAWVRQQGKGRVFYCSMAHNVCVSWDPTFLEFYLAATQFVLGDLPGETAPSRPAPKPATEAKPLTNKPQPCAGKE